MRLPACSHFSGAEPLGATRWQASSTSSRMISTPAPSRSYQLSKAASITVVAGSGRSSRYAAMPISSMKKKSYRRQREVHVAGVTSSTPLAASSVQPGGNCSLASTPSSTVFQPLAGSVSLRDSSRASVVSVSFWLRSSTPGAVSVASCSAASRGCSEEEDGCSRPMGSAVSPWRAWPSCAGPCSCRRHGADSVPVSMSFCVMPWPSKSSHHCRSSFSELASGCSLPRVLYTSCSLSLAPTR